MKGRAPTRIEERRFLEIQDRGCVICYIEAQLQERDWLPEPCDIHHTNGRNNHLETYGNCPWHHRGIRKNEFDYLEMKRVFGPSMVRSPREYRERYGTEQYLLSFQNAMLLQSVEQLARGDLWAEAKTRPSASKT